MKVIEATPQHYVQELAFGGTMPYAKLLPKAFSPSLIAHHNTQGQLLQAWLAHTKGSQTNSERAKKTVFLDFSSEEHLLKSFVEIKPNEFQEEKGRLLKFCAFLQKQCFDSLKGRQIDGIEGILMATKEHVAQLIFLADQDVLAAAAMADVEDVAESLAKVREAFDSYVKKELKGIKDHSEMHDRVPIQSSTLAAVRKKPMVIAEMLLTSSGHLNLGLVDLIKRKFFNEKTPLMHHEQELRHTLDILSGSIEMQNKFHAAVKPFSPYLPSNNLIRISLKLPPETPLEGRHAKLVVLEALLSDLRQGDVGSCFSTSVAIMMMDALKERVLDDLISLVGQGKLTRDGHRDQKDFIPALEIGDSVLQADMTIESSGKMVSGTGFIWEAPGMIDACRQLGLDAVSTRNEIEQAIARIYEISNVDRKKLIEVSPEALLKQVIKAQIEQLPKEEQQRDLKIQAFLAFNNQIHCPLLRGWESCIASMAESKSNNRVRRKITECIASVLEPKWPKPFIPFAKDGSIEKVKKIFENVLNTGMQLRYDPQAFMQGGPAADGRSQIMGAFVLHELKQGTSSLMAKPINSPEQFKKFVISQLQKTRQILVKANEKCLKSQLEALNEVIEFVSRNDSAASSFVKDAIRYYDVGNGAVSNPLEVWQQLQHLPFRDATGNDAAAVYAEATGVAPGQPQTVRPKNAEELLKGFIAFGRKRAAADHFLEDGNPYQRYMVKTMQHAFTLTPEDPSVVGAMDPSQTAEKWIGEHIINPGKEIAQQPATEEFKEKFKQAVCSKILGPELVDGFTKGIKEIPIRCDTIALYGKELLKLLLKMSRHPNARAESILLKTLTDLLLYDVLPEECTAKLVRSAVRIADTNWMDKGAQHLSFACFYNPLVQSVQLALLDETGTRLSPLKQEEWVIYIPWEMYGIKI